MASKRNQRRKSCEGKLRYLTEDEAVSARFGIRRGTGRNLHPYRCAFGAHWHLGHPPARVKQAIAARRKATA